MKTSSLRLFQLPGGEPSHHSQRAPAPVRNPGSPVRRDIGPIGTVARLVAGLLFIGLIVYGQLVATKHFTPAAWALGLLGFPALAFAGHGL
jgi:hypothetical protein